MTSAGLARTALPVSAMVAFAVVTAAVAASAGDTLGYDFLAYHGAARRVIEGRPVYDLGYQQAGGFGLFLYPPTFLPLILPFGLLDPAAATWTWMAAMIVALLAGIRLLPVPVTVRWAVLLLAALDWPVAYTIKLGQVTPLLFLLVVLGWRGLQRSEEGGSAAAAGDRDGRRPSGLDLLGASAAVGAAIKIQPGLLLAWALATRRWRAVVAGVVVLLALAVVATIPVGLGAWFDYVALIRQITDPVTTEHNVTPGWVARGLGLSLAAAGLVQVAVTVAAVGALLVSIRRCTPVASFLIAVAVSQLVSPVLWDHYAMLLLLPVAWLLAQRQWWAVLVPLATSIPLIGVTPLSAYPVLFVITIAGMLLVGAGPRTVERPGTARAAPAG